MSRTVVALFSVMCIAHACTGGNGSSPRIAATSFAPIDPVMDVLTQAEVDAIVTAAAVSNDAPSLAIAVTDRIGNILRIWNRNPASVEGDCDNRIAASLARASAYLSHSQAPLTSRTGQFLSTFHFPPTFDQGTYIALLGTDCAPLRPTLGVANTPQGPLWQIDASNRGAPIESAATVPPTAYDPGQAIPQLTNSDGSTPSPGLTPLPGGVPLYKRTTAAIASPGTFDVERRLVGAVGVYSTDAGGNPQPELGEFAAFAGSLAINPMTGEDYTFGPIPFEGAVYLVGILLPYLDQTARPPGFGPGTYFPALTVFNSGTDGEDDPFDWLISPRDSASGVAFTAAEVDAVITACAQASLNTHAAIRLPATSACRMIITVTDVDGVILGAFRMVDATLFSLEISITKARNAVYYNDPSSVDFSGPNAGNHPLAPAGLPAGTAVTARTLGFLSQPFFPPNLDGSSISGPLFDLAMINRTPGKFDEMGFAPTPADDPSVQPDTQSGVIFFPGSAGLYRNGVLIGGIGVSGDGVEQDDLVTARGIWAAQQALGFQLEPPASIRCDQFSFGGVRLPYWKFPQNPNG